jgi:hypothetical protein
VVLAGNSGTIVTTLTGRLFGATGPAAATRSGRNSGTIGIS